MDDKTKAVIGILAALGIGGVAYAVTRKPSPPIECQTDIDCPEGYICIGGVCVPETDVCLEGQTRCIGNDLWECVLGKWVMLAPNSSLCNLTMGRFQGYVLSTSGNRVLDAKIYIDGSYDSISEANGAYRTDYIAIGSHSITIIADDYEPATFTVDLTEALQQRDFELTPLGDIGGWPADINVLELWTSPEGGGVPQDTFLIGERIRIGVYIMGPYPDQYPREITGSIEVNSDTLTSSYRMTFRNPTVPFFYTPPRLGVYTIRARNRSTTFEVVEPYVPPALPPKLSSDSMTIMPVVYPELAKHNPNIPHIPGEEEIWDNALREYYAATGTTGYYEGDGGYLLCETTGLDNYPLDISESVRLAVKLQNNNEWTAYLDVPTKSAPYQFFTWQSKSGQGKINWDLPDARYWILNHKPRLQNFVILRVVFANGEVWTFPGAYIYDCVAHTPAYMLAKYDYRYEKDKQEYTDARDLLVSFQQNPICYISETQWDNLSNAAYILWGRGLRGRIGCYVSLDGRTVLSISEIEQQYSVKVDEIDAWYNENRAIWESREIEYNNNWEGP